MTTKQPIAWAICDTPDHSVEAFHDQDEAEQRSCDLEDDGHGRREVVPLVLVWSRAYLPERD